LPEPDTGIDVFNVLNILVLFWFFFLLNSRFILSPGIEITLPVASAMESKKTVGIITVQSENLIMFNGDIFSLDTLKQGIKKYLEKKHTESVEENKIVLVRPDKSLPIDTLLKICRISKEAGYSSVQIAVSSFSQ
jgi:biopolymer transport protein ExbD